MKTNTIRQHAKKHITARLHRTVKRNIKHLIPLRIGISTALLIVAIQIIILGCNSLQKDKPVLGLRLEGHIVGQVYGSDFRKQTDAHIDDYENKNITVTVADTTSEISLQQLGVKVDKEQVYKQVLEVGRSGNLVTQLVDQNSALMGMRTISLENTNFNDDLAKTYIASLDQKITIMPTNAHFTYTQEGVVSLAADTKGRIIDVEAALKILKASNPLRRSPVVLPVKEMTAGVGASLLRPLLSEVQLLASKPLKIIAGTTETMLSPAQLVELVIPKVVQNTDDPSKTTAQLTFNEGRLNAIIDDLLKKIVTPPQPTIMNGSQVIQAGKSGLQAGDSPLAHVVSALIQRQTGAAMPEEVHIPLITIAPPIVQQVLNSPRLRTGTGLVRFTFDDGPGAYTEQVLDILKRYNVHATFYVIGRNVPGHASTMQRIRNEGHRIGNHSFSHANLTLLSRAGVAQELASTQAVIQAACGVTPTAFRPPYGAENQTVREVAASMGMSVDLWSVDTRDWAQPGSGAITQRALAGTSSGAVVLLHALHQQTVTALPAIIEGIRKQGFTLE